MTHFDWLANLISRFRPANRHSRAKSPALRNVERLEDRALLTPVTWIAPNDGFWDVGTNWSSGQVPGPADDVTINPAGSHVITIQSGAQSVNSISVPGDDTLQITGGSLVIATASTITNLSVTGGPLTAVGQLTLTGSSVLANNSSTLSGLIRNEGTLNITSSDPNLSAITLDNAGTILNSGGTLDFVGNATLNNLAGAIFDTTFSTNAAFVRQISGSGNLFHNTGTLRRSGTGDASISNLAFQNDASGVIDVTAGSLTLNGSGTMAGGTFTVAAGSALNFNGSTFTLAGSYTGTGPGHVDFSNGTLTPDNATFNFPNGLFRWSSNSATISGGTLNNTGFLQLTGGDPNLGAAVLNNSGTITNAGANLDFVGNAVLNNLEGALFNVAFSGTGAFIRQISGSGNLFHNAGTVRRNASGEASISNMTFQNDASGVVDVTAGSLTLNGNGSMAGGTFNVATGSALNFSGSTFTLSGSYTGAGAGHIEFSNGTLTPNAATFNFPAGFFNWSSNSATISGGTLNNVGFMQLTGADPNLGSATLNNSGTIVNSGASLDFVGNAVLNNLAGAVFDVTLSSNFAFIRNISGGGNLFHNTGTLRRSNTGDASISNMVFQNDASGVIDVTAGSLTLNGSGSMAGGTFNVANASALNFSGSNFTLAGNYTGTGAGHVEFSNGTLTPDNATFNFPQGFFNWSSNSATIANGTLNNTGFLQLTSADPNLDHATLNNSGTITNSGATLDFVGEAILNNLATGLFNNTFDANIAFIRQISGSGNLFHNTGIVRRSGSGDASISNMAFQNDASGVIDVTAGSLTLNGNGSMAGGTFNVALGSALNFSGSTFTLGGNYTGAGGGHIEFSNGTLTPSAATFNFPAGFFNWSSNSATISGGTLNNIGFLQLTNADPNLGAATLNNSGTIVNSGATLDFVGNAILNNLAGAVFDVTFSSNSAFIRNISGGGNLFHNTGTLRRSNMGDASISNMVFQNDASGVIDITAGSVTLNGSGSMAGGTFNAAANSSLNFSSSTFTLAGSYTGSGDGHIEFFNGTLTPDNATFNFPAGFFNWSSNSATISGGTLNNTGFMQLTGADPNLANVTLNNAGTITDVAATLDFTGNAVLNNLAGSLFEITFNGNAAFMRNISGSGNLFHNTGTIRRSAAGDASISNMILQNDADGVIDVTAGSITLNGSGTMAGGTFNVANGTALNFSGSNFTLAGNYTGEGTGHVEFSNGTLTPNNATFNFPEGMFNWSSNSATISNGTLNNAGHIQLTSADPNLGNVTLNNAGTITDLGATLDFVGDATLNNLSGGLIDVAFGFNAAWVRNISGSNNSLNNGGILRRSGTGDASFSGLPLNNTGTVETAAGSFSINSSVAQVAGTVLTGGTWEVQNGTNINLTGTNLLTNAGTLIFHGTGTITGVNGSLTTNNGTIELLDGSGFGANGSFTNNGNLVIGPDSVFSTATTYTQGPDGRVEFQLGGTPASGHFGKLMSTGIATLDGTAAFSFLDGYGPLTGQQFVVATFPSHTGEFDKFEQPLAGKQNTLDPLLQSTQLVVTALLDAADVAVSNITGSSSAISGQNVTVNWTVTNISSSATFTSTWTDSVYLSLDGTYDPSDKLIGRVVHNGTLAPSASYNGTLTLPLPGVLPGHYRFVVISDSKGQMPDSNRANNASTSAATVSTDVAVLTPGVALTGTIANGQDLFFRVSLPALATREITLTTGAAGAAELLTLQGNLPSADENDGYAFNPTSTSEHLLVSGGIAGDFYIVLHGRSGAGAGSSFSLTAQGLNFSVLSVGQSQAKNVGDVTITVNGSQFTDATTFDLHGPASSTINATRVVIGDAGTAYVTFPLGGAAAGNYSLIGHQGALSSTLNNAVTVTTGGTAGMLSFEILSPRYIRPNGRPGIVEIEFRNTGNSDIPAQLLLLSATDSGGNHTVFSNPGGGFPQLDGIQLLTINQHGPAGVLPPGARGTLRVNFEPTGFQPHALTTFTLSHPAANEPVLWNAVKEEMQPSFISDTAWDIVFANFVNSVGSTVGEFEAQLSEVATYLSTVSHRTPTFNDLLNFELLQADDFGRISDRLRPGAFGTGFIDLNSYQVRVEANQDVLLGHPGASRLFVHQSNGTFQAQPGDAGVLTLASGIYTLTETDGSQTVFRNDRKVNYVQTPDGDRVTFGYDGSARITSLTSSSSGTVVTYTYDGTGHVTAIDGADGEHSTFTYDVSGRRTSETTSLGTTTYSYVTTPGSAAFGTFSSVTLPDGEIITYTYNSAGRISRTQNGTGFIDMTYPGPGQIHQVDTTGSSITFFLDGNGQTARQRDAIGQTVTVQRNGLNQMVQIVAADGAAHSYVLNAAGDVTRITQADGTSSTLTYGPLHRVTSFTNGLGNTTQYAYDTFGNPLKTTFADGTTDTVTYDSHGRPITETTRAGQTILATYDVEGKITNRDYPDISDQAYTYDANDNIATITDASGTAHFTYDSRDLLTHVDYPGGQFIDYTYNSAGQRTQISDSSGTITKYIYGTHGQVSEIRDGSNALLVDYTYDAKGRLTRADFANATATTYAYDSRNQITGVTNLAPGGATQSFTNYTYDIAGRRVTMTNGDGITTYGYDIDNRLSSVALPSGRTILYQYDAHGNRITVNDNNVISNYTTNSIDEYTSAGARTLTYDLNGNIATSTVGAVTTTFSYDSAGRVTNSLSPTHSINYQYDMLGQLIAVTDNGVTRKFLYDPTGSGRLLAEFDGSGTLVRSYLQGVGGVFAQLAANGDFYSYGFDGNANVTQLANDSGAVVNTYSYLPYGEVLAQNEGVANPYKFVGQLGVLDLGTGQNYAGVRLYDPNLGRFLSPDAIRSVGVNPYTYANNQPTNEADFNGNDSVQTTNTGLMVSSAVVNIVNTTVGVVGQGVQKAVDAAHAAKVDQWVSKGGGFLQQTEAGVLATASNRVAVANSKFAPVSAKLNTVGAAIDINIFLNNATKYAAGDHSLDSTLNLIHSAGVAGNDILFNSGNPILKGISLGITGIDIATQAPAVVVSNWYYSTDPNDNWGPRAKDIIDNGGVPEHHTTTEQITPLDPNDIIGPSGFGADVIPDGSTPATRFEGFVVDGLTYGYQINYENKASASAPAQVVVITDQLDTDLDWSTFELGDFSFGSFDVQVPAGLSSYHTVVDATATLGVLVDFNATLNFNTGLVTWTLTSIDPQTGDVPIDPLTGFLPPNTSPPIGDGFVRYSIRPDASVANGTNITAQARIFFDLEAPIDTPLIRNTIDNADPISTVGQLPAAENTLSFTVNWSGTDTGGSGIATYDVFVSDNSGPFTPLITGTTTTSIIFNGQQGHTYGFYSVATDNMGRRQATPLVAQATTKIGSVIDPGPTVVWTKKDQPVNVLPQATVGGTTLGGGTLVVNVNAVGTAKKLLDLFENIDAPGSLGTSTKQTVNGHLIVTVQLAENVTASAIQAYLRGIKFSTKGKGLKTGTRTMTVTLTDSNEVVSTLTKQITVRKK